jgi:hypothetical protein
MRDTSASTTRLSAALSSNSQTTSIASKQTKEEQRKFYEKNKDKPLELGDKWYLINTSWFQRWLAYIGVEEPETNISPERINNACLMKPNDNKHLRDDLLEENDYYTVSEELWKYLVNIYSTTCDEVLAFFWFCNCNTILNRLELNLIN